MGPTWVLSAPDGPQVGPTNLAIRVRQTVARQYHSICRDVWCTWFMDLAMDATLQLHFIQDFHTIYDLDATIFYVLYVSNDYDPWS